MTTEEALLGAIEYIERSGVAEHEDNAQRVLHTLQAVIEQKGCEHFDPACTDGALTHLIDIIVFG